MLSYLSAMMGRTLNRPIKDTDRGMVGAIREARYAVLRRLDPIDFEEEER